MFVSILGILSIFGMKLGSWPALMSLLYRAYWQCRHMRQLVGPDREISHWRPVTYAANGP